MRKFYLTTIIFFFTYTLFGQAYYPLIKPNKVWNVLHGDGAQICGFSGGDQYFFQGDTTISGMQYEIIYSYPIVNTVAGSYCPPFAIDNSISAIKAFMREDSLNKKVYIYDQANNLDALLYDFTLSAGDTLNSAYAGSGSPLVIDSVDTITLNNGAVRRIFYLDNSEFYVESIGGSQGLCFPLRQGLGFWNVLTCVNQSNVQLWGNQCYGTVGGQELIGTNFFQVYPNPSQGYLHIKSTYHFKGTFTAFDLTGNIILTKELAENIDKIDISQLSPGTYIYHFDSDLSVPAKGKFTLIN